MLEFKDVKIKLNRQTWKKLIFNDFLYIKFKLRPCLTMISIIANILTLIILIISFIDDSYVNIGTIIVILIEALVFFCEFRWYGPMNDADFCGIKIQPSDDYFKLKVACEALGSLNTTKGILTWVVLIPYKIIIWILAAISEIFFIIYVKLPLCLCMCCCNWLKKCMNWLESMIVSIVTTIILYGILLAFQLLKNQIQSKTVTVNNEIIIIAIAKGLSIYMSECNKFNFIKLSSVGLLMSFLSLGLIFTG